MRGMAMSEECARPDRDEVEVAHEALIRHWPRLRQWLDADRAALLLRDSVREAALAWERHRRDESYLVHRGRRLDEAQTLREHPRLELNVLEQAYLDAALALRRREEQEQEAQRQRELAAQRERANLAEAAQHEAEQRAVEQAAAARRLRRRFIVAAALGAMALLAALGAFYGFRQAGEQRAVAEAQRGIAIDAASTADAERVRADDQAATAEAERGLAEASAATAVAERGRAETERQRADRQAVIARARALAAEAPRQLALAQPERASLLARQAFLFNHAVAGSAVAATDGALRAVLEPGDVARRLTSDSNPGGIVAFSPERPILAAGGNDDLLRLWDLADLATPPVILADTTAPVAALAFSPDARWLGAGDTAGAIHLWDMTDRVSAPSLLAGHDGAVASVAFSPDGLALASGGADGTVRLWDLADLAADPFIVIRRNHGITAVAISPDGQWLAASGDPNGAVLLWDLSAANPGAPPVTVAGGAGHVNSLAFSPDSQTLAAGGEDAMVRLWELRRLGAPPALLSGHEEPVTSLAFSPDGGTLASGSRDRTVRLWDAVDRAAFPIVLAGQQSPVATVAFSPDGETLASGAEDATIWLWRTRAEDLAQIVCQQVSRNLTLVEWRQFVGDDVPYERTCPELPPAEVVLPLVGASAYAQAVPLAVETDDPNLNTTICWDGSLQGFAEIVWPACDRAVALDPTDGNLFDSRGLARALLGDYPGAAQDFAVFVDWARAVGIPEATVRERETWIAELQAGHSPFDAETLERLQTEAIAPSTGSTPAFA
jgi:WD40 repeat protein